MFTIVVAMVISWIAITVFPSVDAALERLIIAVADTGSTIITLITQNAWVANRKFQLRKQLAQQSAASGECED